MSEEEEDGFGVLADAVKRVATAILPSGAGGNHDATGGFVDSLTETVMGVVAGLVKIANSLDGVASAIDNLAHASRDK